MSPPCTLCDAPTEGDEALCPACLADPDQRTTYEAAVRKAREKSTIAAYFAAAREAIRLARVYRSEGLGADPRVTSCLADVRRCRQAIGAIRRGGRPSLYPGLHKADGRTRPAARGRKRGSSNRT